MVPCMIERRDRIYIKRREESHARCLSPVRLMLLCASLPFGHIACKQKDDCVQIRTGKPADPTIGMVGPGIPQHLPAGRHSLPKFLRKAGYRFPGKAESPQPSPS